MGACAFTGHRPSRFPFKYDETDPLCRQIKLQILNLCRWHIANGIDTFYSGGCQGVDFWGAEIVLWLRDVKQENIRLICALPFAGYDSKWNEDQRLRLRKILAAANEVVYVCGKYNADAYKQRNYYMVDHATHVIAVYDPSKALRSGTMQTVNYARRIGRGVVCVWSESGLFAER